jgi:hypothetical protein
MIEVIERLRIIKKKVALFGRTIHSIGGLIEE